MKKQTKGLGNRICIIAGICLLIIAMILLLLWQGGIRSSERKAEALVETIRTLIPQPQGAVPEVRRDNTMPHLSLEGEDFVGILEMPRYGSVLPVCGNWGSISRYPCLFNGNVYEQTIQIGGTAQKGQFDFYREISVGDSVFFTDMEGNRFSYRVTDIRYEKHADPASLGRKDGALTLFIKNPYAFEYVLVFCQVAT